MLLKKLALGVSLNCLSKAFVVEVVWMKLLLLTAKTASVRFHSSLACSQGAASLSAAYSFLAIKTVCVHYFKTLENEPHCYSSWDNPVTHFLLSDTLVWSSHYFHKTCMLPPTNIE